MSIAAVKHLELSEPFLRSESVLAEGPFYRHEDDTFHFIDIKGKLLHRVSLSNPKDHTVLKVDDMLGVACLIEGDSKHYIVAAKKGFGLVDQATGKLTYLAKTATNADQETRYDLI